VRIIYAHSAVADLDSLDSSVAQRILKKIHAVVEQGDVVAQSKALAGDFIGIRRIRVGDYRVLIHIVRRVELHVLIIRHRSRVYE